MSLAMVFAIVAVIAVALYALGQRSSKRPREAQKSLAWLVGVAIAIWLGLAALVMGWFLVSHRFDSEDSNLGETLTEPCADVDADMITRIEANLVGEPAPTIAGAQTAAFNVGGEERRVIMAMLVGPGAPLDPAVFIVDPSGTIYAFVFDDDEISPAQASSTFETVSLDLDGWLEPLNYAGGCPGVFSRR